MLKIQAGMKVLSRFGNEWELLTDPNPEGFAQARRLEDGAEREIHLSQIASIQDDSPAKASP